MELNTMINALSTIHNGTWFTIKWRNTPSNVSASVIRNGHTLVKEVTSTVRKGIHYSHVSAVKEELFHKGQFTIDPRTGEVCYFFQPMASYWEWFVPNVILKHVDKNQFYLRLFTSPNKPKVQWYFDGRPVSADEVKANGWMQPSYWKEKEKPSVMTLKAQDIVSINGIF